MEYSELSIAIQIRTLAAIRQAETLRARGNIAPDSAEGRQWVEENPLMTFVPLVINELKQITEIIKQEY